MLYKMDDDPMYTGSGCGGSGNGSGWFNVRNGIIVTYVYANLETVPHTSTDTDGTCPNAISIDTSYGMNYYLKVG